MAFSSLQREQMDFFAYPKRLRERSASSSCCGRLDCESSMVKLATGDSFVLDGLMWTNGDVQTRTRSWRRKGEWRWSVSEKGGPHRPRLSLATGAACFRTLKHQRHQIRIIQLGRSAMRPRPTSGLIPIVLTRWRAQCACQGVAHHRWPCLPC